MYFSWYSLILRTETKRTIIATYLAIYAQISTATTRLPPVALRRAQILFGVITFRQFHIITLSTKSLRQMPMLP